MDYTYCLSNGTKLSAFVWDDVMDGKGLRSTLEVDVLNADGTSNSRTHKKLWVNKDGRSYFVWHKERVYVDTYEALTVPELIELLESSDWVRESTVYATLMRHTEDFGVVGDIPLFQYVLAGVGLGITGSDTLNTLLIPTETDRYSRKDWCYKVTLAAYDTNIRQVAADKTYYLSDLVSHIRGKHVKLVSVTQYIAEVQKHQAVEDAKLKNRFRKVFPFFFGKPRQHTIHVFNV